MTTGDNRRTFLGISDGYTVTQYTVVLDYKTTGPGKCKQLSAANLQCAGMDEKQKEMSKTLLLVQ